MNALALLAQLGKENAVYLEPKASDAAIQRMQADSRRELGEEVPAGYVQMLRLANGVQIEGAFFKNAEYLVAENVDIAMPEVIVLGNDGNMAYYVFDKRDRGFHTINLGFVNERFQSYETFDDMLLGVLREQQVLKD